MISAFPALTVQSLYLHFHERLALICFLQWNLLMWTLENINKDTSACIILTLTCGPKKRYIIENQDTLIIWTLLVDP